MITIRVLVSPGDEYHCYVDDGLKALFQVVSLVNSCEQTTAFTVVDKHGGFLKPWDYGFGAFEKWAICLYPVPEFVSGEDDVKSSNGGES